MAMSPDDRSASFSHEPPDDLLDAASDLLREHIDPGWNVARPSIVDRVRTGVRRAHPVRGQHDGGRFLISGHVMRVVLAAALAELEDVRPVQLTITADHDGCIRAVHAEISVRYGRPMVPRTHSARDALRTVLVRTLGQPGTVGAVNVAIVDVFED